MSLYPALLTVWGVQACWKGSCLKGVFSWTEEAHEELNLLISWDIISTALQEQVGISVMANLEPARRKGGEHTSYMFQPVEHNSKDNCLSLPSLQGGSSHYVPGTSPPSSSSQAWDRGWWEIPRRHWLFKLREGQVWPCKMWHQCEPSESCVTVGWILQEGEVERWACTPSPLKTLTLKKRVVLSAHLRRSILTLTGQTAVRLPPCINWGLFC